MFCEYCCAEDSLLTRWFKTHGQQAVRLALPDNNMSKWVSARRLLADLRDRAARGQKSLIWAALTCTPWCSWQNFNLKNCRDAG
eukprot:8681514-Heterocapsa_arctica.AAC.1